MPGHQLRARARVLGLRPNSVDYRLARVTELTGLDPGAPRDAAMAGSCQAN
ncbi:helix-turn-helix domain-containing protein [Streptomyces sp. NBC_01518]|uniref:helix-turn-helix domain-containing protein n=1 Tax=Streptomyces sp. NBC_01518 TaxID=2903891 RepID=UPI00386AB779